MLRLSQLACLLSIASGQHFEPNSRTPHGASKFAPLMIGSRFINFWVRWRRHLAELWMVEPEMAWADLEDAATLAEDYVKVRCCILLSIRDAYMILCSPPEPVSPQCSAWQISAEMLGTCTDDVCPSGRNPRSACRWR